MTTKDTPTRTATATGAPVAVECPECGDPARALPPHPHEWPLAGWKPRPRFSHHDGTPLCPVIGPDGYEPADPTGAAPDTRAVPDTRERRP